MAEASRVLANDGVLCINERIFWYLTDRDLCTLRLACKKMAIFIDSTKVFHRRVLKKINGNYGYGGNVMFALIATILRNNQLEEIRKWSEIYRTAGFDNPLEWAVMNGNVEILQEYYKTDMSHFYSWINPLIFSKSSNGYLVEPPTVLELAASNNQMSIVQIVIAKSKAKAIRFSQNSQIRSLVAAAKTNHYEMVKFLKHELDIDCDKSEYRQPLICAATYSGSLKMFKFFGRGHKKRFMNPFWKETSPLHIACERGYLNIVNYLLEGCNVSKGTIIKRGTQKRYSPICLAVINGHLDVVKALLNHTDVEDKVELIERPSSFNTRYSLLNVAAHFNRLDIVKYILNELKLGDGSNSSANNNILYMRFGKDMAIHSAVANENIEMINLLLPYYEDKNIANGMNKSLLEKAAATGNFALTKMIADVNMAEAPKE